MPGRCEHRMTTRECLVCASPKYGAHQQSMTTEREKFEQEMAALGYHQPPALYRDGTYRDTCYSAGWDAWQAAKRDAALDALVADSQAMGAYVSQARGTK